MPRTGAEVAGSGGWAAQHLSPTADFTAPTTAAALALLIATGHAVHARRRRRDRSASGTNLR
ncbi:hypothetical protein ABT124_38100 [Streptomyces sp. NPDC001982]|uniref:hypothetical protein n=1 Tax=Streptomyces sp. NPDC001982 TaxID=3154405 RepID=UPI003330B35B